MNSNNEIDLILAPPEMYLNEHDEKVIIWHDGKITGDMDNRKLINKYISGEQLICELLNIYSDKNPDILFKNEKEKDTIVTAFISPAGGTGKTSTSYSCAKLAAQKGYKTLYINLEEFQTIQLYFDYNTHSFTEVFFYLKQKYKNLKIKLEGIMNCSFDNLYYFSPVESLSDFYSITKEDIDILMNTLIFECEFDLIFFDISCIFPWAREIFKNCTSFVTVANQNKVCKTKMNGLEKELKLIFKHIKIVPKSINVINRYVENALYPFDRNENIIKIPDVNRFIISKTEYVVSRDYEIAIENLLGEVMKWDRKCLIE